MERSSVLMRYIVLRGKRRAGPKTFHTRGSHLLCSERYTVPILYVSPVSTRAGGDFAPSM
jgi:hypothetical protein